jgi:surfeit locus 1 family protein
MADAPRRFPVGLTIATLVAFAILIGLGVWQVKRLAWKTDMLARIEALQHAPAEPLAQTLARGGDLEFHRVSVECPGLATAPFQEIYAIQEGEVVYRLVSACRLGSGPYDALLVDRGLVPDTISTRVPVAASDTPVRVVGVLRKGDRRMARFGPRMGMNGDSPRAQDRVWYGRNLAQMAGALHVKAPVPYFLMAETSTNPDFPQLKPAAVPADIPNNHLSYAITWFGLAAALAGVYAALLRKTLQGR